MADTLAVNIPYNLDLIARVKSIPGARWHAPTKQWRIPRGYKDAAELLIQDYYGMRAPIPRPASWHWTSEPRDWQRDCLEYAYDKPAVLLHVPMRLGKSRAAIDIVANRGHRRTLIICPKSVVPVWPEQFKRWAPPGTFATHQLDTGSVHKNLSIAKIAFEHDVLRTVCIVNYDSCWREPFASWAIAQRWDCLILDEVHKVKGAGTRVSRFAHRLGFSAAQKLGLSGTPLPHSPLDAYGVYRALAPHIFGTNYKKFQETYAIMGGFGNYQVLGYQNDEEFRQKIDTIRFYVSKDALALTPTQHIDVPIKLPTKAREIYSTLAKDFYVQVGTGEVTADNALVKLLRLMQVTSGRVPTDDGWLLELHTAKQEALEDFLEGLDPQEPVVVFSRFATDLLAVCKAATKQGRRYYEMSGRAKELHSWRGDNCGAVLGVQIGTGAEGVDMSKARYCVFYSISHSLAQYDQAIARMLNTDTTRTVAYYHLVVPNSVETTAYDALQKRRDIIEAILQGHVQPDIEEERPSIFDNADTTKLSDKDQDNGEEISEQGTCINESE